MDYLIVSGLLFVLNIVTGCRDPSRSVRHVQSVNIPCLDSIHFPHLFGLILSSLTTRFNSFYLD